MRRTGPHDLIAFDHTMFADFDAVLAASTQVGTRTVISFDAQHTVTLLNVSVGSLHHDDFAFV
jgi:serralysin